MRFSCSSLSLLLQLLLLGWEVRAAQVPEGSAAEARLLHSYFTSLCGCVNAFRGDQGVFTADEVSSQASNAGAFLSPSFASEEDREESEKYAEERCMTVLGLHEGGDLVPTQLGAATGPCCTSMLTSTFLAAADDQGVVSFHRSGFELHLRLNRDSPEAEYQIVRDGNQIVDSGSGLVDGDTVYLVNVGGTSRDKGLLDFYTHYDISATAKGQLVGNQLSIQSLYFQEKHEEEFPQSRLPGMPAFSSKELPDWILGTFEMGRLGQSAFSKFMSAAAAAFGSSPKAYTIPAGDAQCATVTRLVLDFKATGRKSSAVGFLEKRIEERHLSNVTSNVTFAEVRRHEAQTSTALPRMLRNIILRIHYFFFQGGYTKFFGIATSDPGCRSGGGRAPSLWSGSLVRCSRWLMCVTC